MHMKLVLTNALESIVKDMGVMDVLPVIEHTARADHGDYATNIAMVLAKKLSKNPMEIAEDIASLVRKDGTTMKGIGKIEVMKPGFINFWLSEEELLTSFQLLRANDTSLFTSPQFAGKKIMVEYAHPNTHKEMHIGHMRTLITGEALSRLFEAVGAIVFRANYQGDIGPHVAKAIYGVQKIMQEKGLVIDEVEKWSNQDKAHFLGEGYIRGNKDYEIAKDEIDGLNTKLYRKDESIEKIYQITRLWSLDYYSEFYTRFYTHFDKLFFESEMTEAGKKIVEEHIGDIFVKENDAIIFPGEKYGLHTRVFITKVGNPTYEGKEMGNAFTEYKTFPFDLKMHVVGSEQAGYFQVVFKALELLDPAKFKDKQYHVSMGMVTLTDRKMSSRTGDILRVDWLIDQVRERVEQLAKEGRIKSENVDQTVEMITLGAIKYSVLKGGTGQNVAFDIEKSVALDGSSGPYLQYAYVRTQSVLAKGGKQQVEIKAGEHATREPEELGLLRTLYRFEDVVVSSAEHYSPNILSTYLFDLAQEFNLFYQKHKVIGSKEQDFRLALTASVGEVLKKGLDLLGILAPEQM